jgi:hypothetical protein
VPLYGDRDAEPPSFVAVRPRQRFSVTENGVRHSLDPTRDRVSVSHPWVRQRPELWTPVEPMPGQSRKYYERAASRTRSELASLCGREAGRLERGTTRTVDPDTRGSRRPRPLRLP